MVGQGLDLVLWEVRVNMSLLLAWTWTDGDPRVKFQNSRLAGRR